MKALTLYPLPLTSYLSPTLPFHNGQMIGKPGSWTSPSSALSDNTPDTFRIKIWYEDAGSEVVVYDNEMDQAIGGGSIVVHTNK